MDEQLCDVLQRDHNWAEVRGVTRERMAEGATLDSLAASFVDQAEKYLAEGNTTQADGLLFHAVHAGIPPHKLFLECKKRYREERRA